MPSIRSIAALVAALSGSSANLRRVDKACNVRRLTRKGLLLKGEVKEFQNLPGASDASSRMSRSMCSP